MRSKLGHAHQHRTMGHTTLMSATSTSQPSSSIGVHQVCPQSHLSWPPSFLPYRIEHLSLTSSQEWLSGQGPLGELGRRGFASPFCRFLSLRGRSTGKGGNVGDQSPTPTPSLESRVQAARSTLPSSGAGAAGPSYTRRKSNIIIASIPELVIHHILSIGPMLAILAFNIPRRQLYIA